MKTRTWDSGWGLVAVWIVIALTVLLIQSWLFEVAFLISLASVPLALFLGIGLLIVLLSRRAWKSILASVVATVLLVFLPLNGIGHHVWTRISFAQHRATYERAAAQGPGLPAGGTVDGQHYRREGARIVFPRAYGMPDGWSGVVYDPSNTVPLNGESRTFAFGSNIQSCIRIERDWYRCWFD